MEQKKLDQLNEQLDKADALMEDGNYEEAMALMMAVYVVMRSFPRDVKLQSRLPRSFRNDLQQFRNRLRSRRRTAPANDGVSE